jgi:hypothetical protein
VSAIPQDPTLQEVFDHVARHLLSQGGRCTDALSTNALHFGNRKCAIGCLISPREFSKLVRKKPELVFASENRHSVYRAMCTSMGLESLSDEGRSLVASLRDAHDRLPPIAWCARLTAIADHWGFDTSALSDAKAVR